MFNGELKRSAFKRLLNANNNYQLTVEQVTSESENLHKLRIDSSRKLIQNSENYINILANSPKEFTKNVNKLKISFEDFENVTNAIYDSDNVAVVSGSTIGGGAIVGTGVAVLAPTAAMAVATTFGAASTGTAISALSGAAATNAALAWLGGGAIAAGGGGMAGGSALLALSGPIGWSIGGAALLGGGVYMRKKNKKISEKANGEACRIQSANGALAVALEEIKELHKITKRHSVGATNQLAALMETAPSDYLQFSEELKSELGALINNINSLSKLLVKNVG